MYGKRAYNRRVMEVEHGSFTPLVFTTSGVMSHECSIYHKTLAEKLSKKKEERYDVIVRYLRVKLVPVIKSHPPMPTRITWSDKQHTREWRGLWLCTERAWLVREEEDLPGKMMTEKKEETKDTVMRGCLLLIVR